MMDIKQAKFGQRVRYCAKAVKTNPPDRTQWVRDDREWNTGVGMVIGVRNVYDGVINVDYDNTVDFIPQKRHRVLLVVPNMAHNPFHVFPDDAEPLSDGQSDNEVEP